MLTKFPFTDLSSSKRRPALVLTEAETGDTDVIVAFISSVIPSHPRDTELVFSKNHPEWPVPKQVSLLHPPPSLLGFSLLYIQVGVLTDLEAGMRNWPSTVSVDPGNIQTTPGTGLPPSRKVQATPSLHPARAKKNQTIPKLGRATPSVGLADPKEIQTTPNLGLVRAKEGPARPNLTLPFS